MGDAPVRVAHRVAVAVAVAERRDQPPRWVALREELLDRRAQRCRRGREQPAFGLGDPERVAPLAERLPQLRLESQALKAGGMPERGYGSLNFGRTEAMPVSWPSANAEFAPSAASSGRYDRSPL